MAFRAYQEIRYEKPVIQIFCSDSVAEVQYRELIYGIEEEGIPYQVQVQKEQNPVRLAYEAGKQSRLDVGLGVGEDRLVLHYEKLAEDCPLFVVSMEASEEAKRALGSNAARLVKKIPFKII